MANGSPRRKKQPNGSGHTYKVGNSFKTVISVQGKKYTGTAKSKQESRRLALSRAAEGKTWREKKIGLLKSPRLSDFMKSWLEEEHRQHIAFSTYRRYESLFRIHIAPTLGKLLMIEIDPKRIYEFLYKMKTSGQSPRSMQQTRALLSLVFRAAEEQGHLISNPIDKVRNPQSRENLIDSLTKEEVRRLLETHKGGIQSARLHIAVLCGLRQGEALGLKWNDIDLNKASLRVERQLQIIEGELSFVRLKTVRSQRVVMLGVETVEVLRNHRQIVEKIKHTAGLRWIDNDLVFPDQFGEPTSPHADYNSWKRSLKICGLPEKRLHDARHTAATLMYSQGIGIEIISRVLGHSSSAITSRLYVHSAEEPLRRAAETMSEIFKD